MGNIARNPACHAGADAWESETAKRGLGVPFKGFVGGEKCGS